MEIDEGRLLAALRSCELEPNDLIALRNFVTASLDPVQLVCSFNIESNSECSEEIHPPIGKITTIVAHWKLKENGFGHHFYLQWLPPESIDSEIESYYININNYIFETQSSIPEFEVDILDPESSEYRVRILAVGQNDLGEFSEWVVAKELDPPPAPTRGLRCIERRDDSLKFWWGDEKSDDDDKIFTLEMKSGKCCYSPSMDLFREQRNQREKLSFTPVYSGPSHSFKLEDLVPDTEYEIRICASNLAGEAGPYSEVSTFSTSHIVPHTVRTFRALTKMEIEWRTWDKKKKLRLKKLRLGAKKYSPVILKLLLKARKYRPSARKYPLRIRKHPLRIRKGLQRKPPPHSRSSRGLEKSEYFPPRTIRTSPATRKCGICVLENKRIQSFNEEHGTEKRRQVPILRAVRDVGVIPLVGGVHIKWLKPLVSDYCSFSYNVKMNNLSFNTNDDGRDIAIKGLDPDASYRIQIQAVSCDGPGPLSEVVETKTRPGLPIPLQMKCIEAGYNHLRLYWYLLGDKRDDIISYRLEMLELKSFQLKYHGPAVTSRVLLLKENTEYEFRVCAFSLDGQGQYSDVYKFKTSSPDTLNSSNKIVDQANPSAVKIEKATSDSEAMVQTATVSEMLKQTTSAIELMDQTATVSEIMEQTAAASEIIEQVCPTPEAEKQAPVVDQDDHSSLNMEHVTSTSKVMKQSATASEVLEQTASAFQLIGQTAIVSEIMEQVYPTPKTENQVPVTDQADPSPVMIEQVTPVSKAMEQTATASEVMEQEETAIASEVTEQAVTVSEVMQLTFSFSEIIKQIYPSPEAKKQVAFKPSSLLRSTEDKNNFMDERDDGLSRKKSKKNKDCILLENSSCCKFYNKRIHFEERQMDAFMNYIQDRMFPDAVRERFYVCPSSCFNLLPGLSPEFLKTIGDEMLQHTFDRTVKIDFFKKDIIVIPILMNGQWSLVIICYPGLIPETPESAKRTEFLKLMNFRFSRDRGVSSNKTVHGDKKGKESSTSKNAQEAKVPCLYIFPIGSKHDSCVIAIRLKVLLEWLWKHYKGTERVLDFKKLDIYEIAISDLANIEPKMKLLNPEIKILHITEQFLKETNEGAKCKKYSKVPNLSGRSTKGLHMLLHIICDVNVLPMPSETTGLKTMDKETEKTSESGGSKSNSNIKNPVRPSNLEPFLDYFKTKVPYTLPPPPLDITAKKLFGFLYHITSRDIPDLAEWNPDTISQFKESLNWC